MTQTIKDGEFIDIDLDGPIGDAIAILQRLAEKYGEEARLSCEHSYYNQPTYHVTWDRPMTEDEIKVEEEKNLKNLEAKIKRAELQAVNAAKKLADLKAMLDS